MDQRDKKVHEKVDWRELWSLWTLNVWEKLEPEKKTAEWQALQVWSQKAEEYPEVKTRFFQGAGNDYTVSMQLRDQVVCVMTYYHWV